jgi:hypothetical protein
MDDGLIDLRKDFDCNTVSNSILSEHNKAFGIGRTPNVTAKVTINNNNFLQLDTSARNPSADNLRMCYLYNNYHRDLTSYGNYAPGPHPAARRDFVLRKRQRSAGRRAERYDQVGLVGVQGLRGSGHA